MKKIKRIKKFFKAWFRVNWEFLNSLRESRPNSSAPLVVKTYPHLLKNVELKDKHKGKRVFILCTGPSIGKMNLLPLKNEICFSVSNFYKHSNYKDIKPLYHLVPNAFPPHTDETLIAWFREMGQQTEGAVQLHGELQKALIEKNDLFKNTDKYFLNMTLEGEEFKKLSDFDLTRPIPGVQSVAVMSVVAAIYMGFREIYLLGVDHDAIATHKYDYFYPRNSMITTDDSVNEDGTLKDTRLDVMIQVSNLWKQYIEIERIARTKGVQIFNATKGSYLDVFPMVDLENVLKS